MKFPAGITTISGQFSQSRNVDPGLELCKLSAVVAVMVVTVVIVVATVGKRSGDTTACCSRSATGGVGGNAVARRLQS